MIGISWGWKTIWVLVGGNAKEMRGTLNLRRKPWEIATEPVSQNHWSWGVGKRYWV